MSTEQIPMIRSVEFGCMVPAYQYAPCGAKAYFEQESTVGGYRCQQCFAILGSMGMPSSCAEQDTNN